MFLNTPRLQFLGTLPEGETGTRTTLRMMRSLVRTYKRNPLLRNAAVDLVSGLAPKDWMGEVNALFQFVRDYIRYTKDVNGVETLQTPDATLDIQAGDCDDKSTLLATLLESIGYRTRFVAVGYIRPGAYSHVYVEALVMKNWLALDATMPHNLGWAPRKGVSRLVVEN